MKQSNIEQLVEFVELGYKLYLESKRKYSALLHDTEEDNNVARALYYKGLIAGLDIAAAGYGGAKVTADEIDKELKKGE